MPRLTIPEVFEAVENAPTEQDRIMILKRNETPALLSVLMYGLHPDAKFDVHLPEKFRRTQKPRDFADMSLFAEARRLYIFLDSYKKVTPAKKTEILAIMLENLGTEESLTVERIIRRQFAQSYVHLNVALVNKAFPKLIPVSDVVTDTPVVVEEKVAPVAKKKAKPAKAR